MQAVFYWQMSLRANRPSTPTGRVVVVALALLGLVLSAGRAEADRAPGAVARRAEAKQGRVVVSAGARGRVDWTRGLLIATGAASGDLRAPSPGVARVAAERAAREAARAQLAKRAAKLVLASGKRVSAVAGADKVVARRLAHAVKRSLDLSVDYSSDGSVVLTSGLPLEAIRLAVEGAAHPPARADSASPTAVIVDATGVLAKPVLGLELAVGKQRYAGPTVFYRGEKAAARDPRVGDRPVRARAKRRKHGRLWLAGGKHGSGGLAPETLAGARESGALVVILLPK